MAGEVSAVSFTMQIETINYIQKVPQCLIFSPISLFIGICKNAGAGGLWLFGAGGGEPNSRVWGTLPIASFPLSLLILISCFCNCPVESWAGSSAGAAGMGIKPFAGPGCCLGGRRARAGPAAHHLLFPWPVFDRGTCRALCKTQSWAGEGLVLGAGWKTLFELPGWDRVPVGWDGA